MQQYSFEATDQAGNHVSGTVSAPGEALAANQIGQMGYALLSLHVVKDPSQEPLDSPQASGQPEPTLPMTPARLPLNAYSDRGGGDFDANATAEMPSLSRPLEPWERNAPLPQEPLPVATLNAAGVAINRTQPMMYGARESVMTQEGAPGIGETPRGLETSPAESDANKPLQQLFMEKMIYPFFSGVVLKDLAPYYRQFATLIGAGLPMFQSLSALEGNTQNPKLKEITRAAQLSVQRGGQFSEVMRRWPWVFKPIEMQLIRASEMSGTLEETLRQIADYVEHDLSIKRLVQREMFYPVLVLLFALMILGRPGFIGGTMAFVSLILGGMGQGKAYSLLDYFLDTIGFGLGLFAMFLVPLIMFRLFLFNVKGVRESYDRFKLGIPVIGNITKMFALARFSRTLAALSRSGFGMGQGLDIAADASGNAVLHDAVDRARVRAERGELVSTSLSASSFFPPMAIDMMRTGETAGRSDEMLDKIADFNESEGKIKLHMACIVFGVIVFLIVAILVAVQVISFYMGYGSNVMRAGGEGFLQIL